MTLKKLLTGFISMAVIACSFYTDAAALTIFPEPQSMMQTKTAIRVSASEISVYAKGRELKELVKVWDESLAKPYKAGEYTTEDGFRRIVSDVVLPDVKTTGCRRKADVKLFIDKHLAEEAYTLDISHESLIVIKGGSTKGVWWGLQSLTQILIESAAHPRNGQLAISGLHVEDHPDFAYRSAMLDCVRHFWTVEEVKQYIDILALHKLNTFHWHLTDDQGWRIEIKKYPKLTEIGAWRKETAVGWGGRDGYDGKQHGGFYTQEQVRDIIAYAAARQITIIPEIEMPGHAEAALAAYNNLGCKGEGYEVWPNWGVNNEVFCIGRESTFEFLEGVLDEVCALFPGEYIHIGGDECPRDRWKECPDCQKRIKDEGLANVGELQGYMLKRIEKYVNAKGKHIIGWDEILESEVTPTATVMSWRGPQGGIKAAKIGNKVVMAPNSHFYLDYYQTNDHVANNEPMGIGGKLPLEKCWSFEPYDQLNDNEKKYILGIQANTWTEYIETFNRVQFMDLPRFCALSGIAWHKAGLDYDEFLSKVKESMLKVYQYYGLIYAPYAFEE